MPGLRLGHSQRLAYQKLPPHKVAERLGGSRRIGKTNKRPFGFHTYIKALDVGGRVPSVVQVHRLEAEKADENLKEEKQRKSEWLHRSKLPPSFVS
ncbi:hypothetical protein GR197_22985 [Rhizobium phaseoli]|uniref:Uncharacterized protein n=1 Tax=Rhizobium phaseoli TaxID=396 RepID=A0A7K3UIR1_9HYPH|nr:hypothetical protein [Rhizobium phaseoli]NEJ73371.1 hypothetical protein [Rhizobium phaseoli]